MNYYQMQLQNFRIEPELAAKILRAAHMKIEFCDISFTITNCE